MANFNLRKPENVPGPLFTDTTCIDCGTCYHIAPQLFKEQRESSTVIAQPQDENQWSRAKAAIISCPTNSIGVKNAPLIFKEVSDQLPLKVDANIFYCGYTARSSFGATSYFIQRPEGNILIDSPRFHPHLAKKLEELGGVKWMLLSHRDDVADHSKWAAHFKCTRVIHELEVEGDTAHCEMKLQGSGEWELLADLKILFTPGHTQGHISFLYQDHYLFTGDHLFWSPERQLVYASKSVSWYSWEVQQQSVANLLKYNFDWVLPGHGGWVKRCPELIRRDLSA